MTGRLDRLIVGGLMGYALVCTISVAMANFFIDATLVLAAVRLWQSRDGLNIDRGLALAFTGMVIAAALAGVFAIDSGKSGEPVWFLLYHSAPLFLAMAFVRGSEQATRLLQLMAASLLLSSLYAIFQATQGVVRPAGFTGNWVILAGQLCILMPTYFVLSIADSSLSRRWRQGLILLLIPASGALLVNGTRGAWLAVGTSLLAGALLLVRQRRQLRLLLLVAALSLALAAGMIASQQNTARFVGRGMQTAVERTLIWQSALQMIADHPWLGVGPGNFGPQYLHRYMLPEAREKKAHLHAHNNLLAVGSEMGLIGLAAYVVLFFYILRHFWRQARAGDPNARALAALWATLGLQLHGLSEYSFLAFPTVIQTYWFLIGLFWRQP